MYGVSLIFVSTSNIHCIYNYMGIVLGNKYDAATTQIQCGYIANK